MQGILRVLVPVAQNASFDAFVCSYVSGFIASYLFSSFKFVVANDVRFLENHYVKH